MVNQCLGQERIGFEFRLNPCRLPQTTRYLASKTGNQMFCSLNEQSVFLKIETPSNLSHLIPVCHFKGIATRVIKTLSGEKAVTLELFHADEEACIPLLMSRDLSSVLLDWRLWADTYSLPMLMINEDGSITAVEDRFTLRQFFSMTSHPLVHKRFVINCDRWLGVRLVIDHKAILP
ncbi:DUF6101 family protein [Bartonella ancashensis]|uniref:Uncharacterized protein n=1 Tax=Bartonella ancashensis TaxID=1318743 RepID=A0A0M4LHE7_9HYPH|nr:DUF6101 family protein [Bartonella ancashensis]ALE04069.1 hypothetical protein PU02_1255 [Bartonella ancashensis]